MEGNRRNFLKSRSNPQFKKSGASTRGKWQNASHEQFSETFTGTDTIYRILCESRKIGSLIGKGGNIIKALREETQARITVSDSIHGSDEREIIISSPYTRKNHYCAAQDALLKVHDMIIAKDDEILVTARLLVPNYMIGCLIGRKGDVIQRLRTETGANIKVLSSEYLPICAMATDQLLQIQGKAEMVKKALYQVSTLLHENPRKDRAPLIENLSPPGYIRNSHGIEYRRDDYDYEYEYEYDDDKVGPSEFSMKILCPRERIGGVIGKGGWNVKQLEIKSGASIYIEEDITGELNERVICASSIESLCNQRSETIDAILKLQDQTSEISEKGIITTKLLVHSNKIGCLIGEKGRVINEMRRRTQADIRIIIKEDKPKCASPDEDLVQISGSMRVAKDALAEIGSRLRTRYLQDANIKAEPIIGRFGPVRNCSVGTSDSYEFRKDVFHGYEDDYDYGHPYQELWNRNFEMRDTYEYLNAPPLQSNYESSSGQSMGIYQSYCQRSISPSPLPYHDSYQNFNSTEQTSISYRNLSAQGSGYYNYEY